MANTNNSKADRLVREIRDLIDDADPHVAVRASWQVAINAAIRAYGQPHTVCALRDMADEIERDLMAQIGGTRH